MKYYKIKEKVRFNEIDAYQVAWHGHYVTWMEIGRNALAGQFGLDAGQLREAGFLGPVVELELKFLRPARFGDELTICTTMCRCQTATLKFMAEIYGADGIKLATGSTTHALTDLSGLLQFQLPNVIAERLNRLLEFLDSV